MQVAGQEGEPIVLQNENPKNKIATCQARNSSHDTKSCCDIKLIFERKRNVKVILKFGSFSIDFLFRFT